MGVYDWLDFLQYMLWFVIGYNVGVYDWLDFWQYMLWLVRFLTIHVVIG